MRLLPEADGGSGGYRGLIAGLRAAQGPGATDVEVWMDSRLVAKQVSGRRKAAGLVGEIGRGSSAGVRHSRRYEAQANQAMDAQAVR